MPDQQPGFPLVCINDNPATWRREVWQDGKKIASFCWTLFDHAGIARKTLPFYCPSDLFRPGQLWGDAKAMEPCKGTPSTGGWWRVKSLVALLGAADSEPKGGGDDQAK